MRFCSLLMTALLLGSGPSAAAEGAATELEQLLAAEWERTLEDNPTMASALGDRRWNDRWPDLSMAAIEAQHAADREALARLEAIDASQLPISARLDRDMYQRDLEERIDHYRFRRYLVPLNQRGGPHSAYDTVERLRLASVRDYEDWLARVRAFGDYADQALALMAEGIDAGIVHPRVIATRIAGQLETQAGTKAEDSPWAKPFLEVAAGLPEAERQRLKGEGLAAVREVVLPAYGRMDRFFRERYLPAARETVGIWDQPDGREYYVKRVRHFTTTALTPREVHEIGLNEVARIRAEMESIRKQVGFDGDLAAFFEHLRTDPKFYYDSPEALFEAYLAASKRVDPELVKLFGRLPRMPYGVRPIPEAIAPDTTTAYYSRPAADGSRAGYYYVNLYRPEVRPKYEIEALTIHEAVPGHHLQIALAMELEGLPAFRRFGGVTAYVEGWALYSESLGPELGMYTDPYSKFGQLTYEMWRAVRLVVDTGIHELGWERQQAIDYFRDNAAKTEADIVNEIDRYIAWPGQALAYKIGELKIKELRARSQDALGEDFDIRAFHDLVLSNGAIPLDSLERLVDEWLAAQAGG
jgi:prolyl oligopeptidase